MKAWLMYLLLIVLLALALASPSYPAITIQWREGCYDGYDTPPITRGYYVYHKPCKYFCSYEPKIDVGDVKTYLDEDTIAGKTYCYKVSAYNGAGESKTTSTLCTVAQ